MKEFEGTYWIVVTGGGYVIARTLRRSRGEAIRVVTEEEPCKPWDKLCEEGWHVVEVEIARHATIGSGHDRRLSRA
jgi:hypothetical protein